jgi:transposase-like protein
MASLKTQIERQLADNRRRGGSGRCRALTAEQEGAAIRAFLEEKLTIRALAQRFGVGRSTVARLLHRAARAGVSS